MKYAAVLIVGTLLGAATALLLLYYNPLTGTPDERPSGADWTLTYRFPEGDALAFTHGAHRRLTASPDGIQELWEKTISGSALTVLALRGTDGAPAVLASRLTAASSHTDLLLAGVLLSDHWLLTVPGQGSLYVRADNNVWPFLKDSLVPVWYLQRPWRGPTEYRPTAGPGPRETGVVIGASGRFADVGGSAVERYRLQRFSTAGLEELLGELHLDLAEPVSAAAE